jgi:hypothetical protein
MHKEYQAREVGVSTLLTAGGGVLVVVLTLVNILLRLFSARLCSPDPNACSKIPMSRTAIGRDTLNHVNAVSLSPLKNTAPLLEKARALESGIETPIDLFFKLDPAISGMLVTFYCISRAPKSPLVHVK